MLPTITAMPRQISRTLMQLAAGLAFASIAFIVLTRNYRTLPNTDIGYMPVDPARFLIADITIAVCSIHKPFSSCRPDPGVWHRVNKELYLGKAWTSKAYIYVKRKQDTSLEDDDKIVIGVSVGQSPPKDDKAEVWEVRPGGLWVKRSAMNKESKTKGAVTGIDILFGDDAVEARDGWEMAETPLSIGTGGRLFSAHLSIRRGNVKAPIKPTLNVNKNGRFKIMQVADLHLKTGVGECHEAVPDSENCQADPRSLAFVTKMLQDEKPDLVILSGDQLNGDRAPDATTAILKFAKILRHHKVPYACIFGNHDDEKTMSRKRQMELLETLPYSLSQAGPAELDGVGNYYVEILAGDEPAMTVYMLDTHAFSPRPKFSKYDWLKPSQIEWFRQTASTRRNSRSADSKHMDISFIHIPLPEYDSSESPRLGKWREGVGAANFNTGFRDVLLEQGIVMVSAGHDHCNDYCLLSSPDAPQSKSSLWMCYAGGVGFGGYGCDDFVRRVRVFDIDTKAARITTWKRLEHGEDAANVRLDEQVIVEGGKPKKLALP